MDKNFKIYLLLTGVIFLILILGSVYFSRGEEETPEYEDEKLNLIYEINKNYFETHTYSSVDWFVCKDMAIDVWNLLKTQGINAKLCAGNVDDNIKLYSENSYKTLLNYFKNMNHAWVLAENEPFKFVAVETTGGFLVFGDENKLYFENATCFYSPSEFKEFDTSRLDFIKICEEADSMINYWNENMIGKKLTAEDYELKGKLELKKQECDLIIAKLNGIIA